MATTCSSTASSVSSITLLRSTTTNHYPHQRRHRQQLFTRFPFSFRSRYPLQISASADLRQQQTSTTATESVREKVLVLKNAAKTRKVPSSEVLSALSAIKDNASSEVDLQTLGGTESPGRTWMLVFTAQGSRFDKGSYFPLTAVQRFDAAAKRIENGVYLGPLGYLTFEGRFSWKKRILAFVFECMRIKIGPFGPLQINLGNVEDREPSTKDPFFMWFYVDEEIVVAKGRGGGTAFWCRCRRTS